VKATPATPATLATIQPVIAHMRARTYDAHRFLLSQASLASQSPLADEAAERAARQAEPLLPAPGTAERERMDRRHAEMIGGLLAAYRMRPAS
jgi:hypothetical protein